VQNLTLIALSSAEKSVTIQTKNTQTVNDISTPGLSACVDNELLLNTGTVAYAAGDVTGIKSSII